MLPATVTGSWPRPRWYDGGLWGRPLDTALLDVRFREQFLDAHSTVIADQERAGLDILTNGDYHLDEDFAGRSWHHYPLQRWKGLEHEELQYERSRDALLAFPPGHADERDRDDLALAARRRQGRAQPEEPARVRQAVAHRPGPRGVGKPVKFGTCSSQVLVDLPRQPHVRIRPRRQEAAHLGHGHGDEPRASPARRRRGQGHPDRGADDPLHRRASTPRRRRCSTSWSRRSTTRWKGLDDVELWIHTCWGNPMMQKVYSGESYANSIDTYLNRLKGDVWTVEMTERDFAEIDLFKPYANNLSKKVAVGVVNHRQLQADLPSVVAGRVRKRPGGDPGGQAGAVVGLRLRPPGLQPDWSRTTRPRPSPRAATSCSRSWASRSVTSPARRPGAPDRRPARPRAADAPAVALALRVDPDGRVGGRHGGGDADHPRDREEAPCRGGRDGLARARPVGRRRGRTRSSGWRRTGPATRASPSARDSSASTRAAVRSRSSSGCPDRARPTSGASPTCPRSIEDEVLPSAELERRLTLLRRPGRTSTTSSARVAGELLPSGPRGGGRTPGGDHPPRVHQRARAVLAQGRGPHGRDVVMTRDGLAAHREAYLDAIRA